MPVRVAPPPSCVGGSFDPAASFAYDLQLNSHHFPPSFFFFFMGRLSFHILSVRPLNFFFIFSPSNHFLIERFIKWETCAPMSIKARGFLRQSAPIWLVQIYSNGNNNDFNKFKILEKKVGGNAVEWHTHTHTHRLLRFPFWHATDKLCRWFALIADLERLFIIGASSFTNEFHHSSFSISFHQPSLSFCAVVVGLCIRPLLTQRRRYSPP